jgi:ribosomal protein S27AE
MKRVNIEKYAEPPRTPYDQLMNKVYDPQNKYYAAPFPMQRTNADMEQLKKWCPKCGFGFVSDHQNVEHYANPPRTHYDQLMNKVYDPQNKYYAAPFPMQRTNADLELMKTWCPKCGYGFVSDHPMKPSAPSSSGCSDYQIKMGCEERGYAGDHIGCFDNSSSDFFGKCKYPSTPGGPNPNPVNPYSSNFTTKEHYCGGNSAGGMPALGLQDNDNMWSYNARMM